MNGLFQLYVCQHVCESVALTVIYVNCIRIRKKLGLYSAIKLSPQKKKDEYTYLYKINETKKGRPKQGDWRCKGERETETGETGDARESGGPKQGRPDKGDQRR